MHNQLFVATHVKRAGGVNFYTQQKNINLGLCRGESSVQGTFDPNTPDGSISLELTFKSNCPGCSFKSWTLGSSTRAGTPCSYVGVFAILCQLSTSEKFFYASYRLHNTYTHTKKVLSPSTSGKAGPRPTQTSTS